MTAAYDAAIARWFAEDQFFPDQLTLTFRKITDLPYGENPHQTAAYYEEVGLAEAPALAREPARRPRALRTTTSPTSRPRGGSCASWSTRLPRSSSSTRTHAGSRSPRRSSMHMRARSPPIRSPPTAACCC